MFCPLVRSLNLSTFFRSGTCEVEEKECFRAYESILSSTRPLDSLWRCLRERKKRRRISEEVTRMYLNRQRSSSIKRRSFCSSFILLFSPSLNQALYQIFQSHRICTANSSH